MKRLFIALDISETARDFAARFIENLRIEFSTFPVAWERPEKLHITLKFLGRTEDAVIEKIKMTVAEIARQQRPFKLALEGSGVFPSSQNPRVLWLGIADGEKELDPLADTVIDETTKLGFRSENRGFKSHLTIARIKEPEISKYLAEKHLRTKYKPVEFEITNLVLYESQLKPTGSVYSTLELFPFR